jgi:hypothetical protein
MVHGGLPVEMKSSNESRIAGMLTDNYDGNSKEDGTTCLITKVITVVIVSSTRSLRLWAYEEYRSFQRVGELPVSKGQESFPPYPLSKNRGMCTPLVILRDLKNFAYRGFTPKRRLPHMAVIEADEANYYGNW